MKGAWSKPAVVVLARGTAEEHVLAGCKNTDQTGPAWTHLYCRTYLDGWCNNACSAFPAS